MSGLLAGSAGADRTLEVNLLWDARLNYRLERPGSPWKTLPDGKAGRNLVKVSDDRILLDATRRSFFFVYRAKEDVPGIKNRVNPQFRRFLDWPQWGVLAAIVAGLGFLQYRKFWKKKLADEIHEPLIRADGKLPKRPVGDYRLTGILGSGAMGLVYRGEDKRGKAVAIKVPAPHLISEGDFQQRFLREIQLGIKLNHPRVVRVLELPLGDEPYVVLEFVDGTPLDQVALRPWEQEWQRCRVWLEQALEALAYIHSQGVIHRDLKPANLMVTRAGDIKLMDFGIAHKIHGTRLTGTGHILGTPIYMAPEQITTGQVDVRSDLYSLGLIVYERLAPGLPHPQEVMELLRLKMTQPLRPLSQANPRISNRLDAFMNRLIAQEPDHRFASAQEALEHLRMVP